MAGTVLRRTIVTSPIVSPPTLHTLPVTIRQNIRVLLIIRMPLWTMRFLGVCMPLAMIVNRVCNKFQVFRVNTASISTQMVTNQTQGNGAFTQRVCQAVCLHLLGWRKTKDSIPIVILPGCPFPAIIGFINLCPKPLFNRRPLPRVSLWRKWMSSFKPAHIMALAPTARLNNSLTAINGAFHYG